jgi:hypothetical protein
MSHRNSQIKITPFHHRLGLKQQSDDRILGSGNFVNKIVFDCFNNSILLKPA